MTGGFPSQRTNNSDGAYVSWRNHAIGNVLYINYVIQATIIAIFAIWPLICKYTYL